MFTPVTAFRTNDCRSRPILACRLASAAHLKAFWRRVKESLACTAVVGLYFGHICGTCRMKHYFLFFGTLQVFSGHGQLMLVKNGWGRSQQSLCLLRRK